MSYSDLKPADIEPLAMTAFHHLVARSSGGQHDQNAIVLEKILHEAFARMNELELMKTRGKWTDRERARFNALADEEKEFPR